jgi:hypothetical protein
VIMMNARCRLNPTNGVGGLFTPDLQSGVTGLTSSKLEGGQQVRVGRLDLNNPPTPLVVLDNNLDHLPSD